MKRRHIREKCSHLIRSLDLTVPFSLDTLCAQVAERRQRRIGMAPLAFPPTGPVGLLVTTASVDYVFYEAHTTATHQTHIAVHELGHLLWDHAAPDPEGGRLDDPAGGSLVPDDIDPALIGHMLRRTQYSEPEEYAAEYFATEILGVRRASGPLLGTAVVPPDEGDFAGRLGRSLQHGGDH
ncbi:hypothetical protein M2271_000995 [Streptomyces sp. LBL]|uniref:hypothetical protein n=1 Tax=Streptomyces sp. LBL TaxID=2940562 RepID=UPI002473E271|nr:hypothetical protein [Streptomyces sp. LBL]MDH6623208.1 hypothetical protein [Streptomyces sp. LBL]